jgi:hypothetical protein
MEDAHKLAAHVFGIQNVAHYKTMDPRDQDGINQSVYEEAPAEYVLKPHTRNYREKKDRQGFPDRTFEKLIQRNQYLQEVQQEKQLVLKYIRNQRIVFAEITDIIPERAKNIFLEWISKANMNTEKKGRTEYGQEYLLIRQEGTCVLHCMDGNLTMPSYVMEFKE